MNLERMIDRQYLANLLALQCALRIGGLMGISAISAARKALDTYSLCLRHGAEYVKNARVDDPPQKLMVICADALSECAEKNWQDFRNNIQIYLLTQDEALIWVARIERALSED